MKRNVEDIVRDVKIESTPLTRDVLAKQEVYLEKVFSKLEGKDKEECEELLVKIESMKDNSLDLSYQ